MEKLIVNRKFTKVLGVSASLRNSRFSMTDSKFCEEVRNITSQKFLNDYLKKQTGLLLDEFQKAGREQKLDYDKIYKTLLKQKGERGLSNSEAALAAGLWGAFQEGSEIAYELQMHDNARHRWKIEVAKAGGAARAMER